MAFVVADGCVRCKYTDCVEICPIDDCFREGPNFLVIDPITCIDCSLCVAECPAEAIFAEDEVPEDQLEYISINTEMAKVWPAINQAKAPLPEADEWIDVADKIQYLNL